MPDQRTLIYAGTAGGPPQLMRKNLDTGVVAELISSGPRFREPYDVTPDGKWLSYGERSETGEQLWMLALEAPSPAQPLRGSRSSAFGTRFSPDGRYYTFTSWESGRAEVYLAPLAGGSGQAVSAGGGSRARWSPDGDEILYLSADSRIVSVPVRRSPTLELGKPETLFVLHGKGWTDFDIAPRRQAPARRRQGSRRRRRTPHRKAARGGRPDYKAVTKSWIESIRLAVARDDRALRLAREARSHRYYVGQDPLNTAYQRRVEVDHFEAHQPCRPPPGWIEFPRAVRRFLTAIRR